MPLEDADPTWDFTHVDGDHLAGSVKIRNGTAVRFLAVAHSKATGPNNWTSIRLRLTDHKGTTCELLERCDCAYAVVALPLDAEEERSHIHYTFDVAAAYGNATVDWIRIDMTPYGDGSRG
jgi:hypothetical protein